MCFLAWLNVGHFEQALAQQTQTHLQTTARAEAEKLERMVADIEKFLLALANDQRFARILHAPAHIVPCRLTEGIEPELLDYISQTTRRLELIDSGGTLICSYPQDAERAGMNMGSREDIARVLENPQRSMSEVYTEFCSVKTFSICQPLYENDSFIGILRAEISLEKIHRILSEIRVGQEGYVWVIDSDGIIISHPDPELLNRHVRYVSNKNHLGPNSELEQVWSRMIAGEIGVDEYEFVTWQKSVARPVRKIIAFYPLKFGNKIWSLGLCMEYTEISGPVKAHWREVLIMMFIITLILVEVGLNYYRTEQRKSRLETELKISKVNQELLLTSDERAQFAAQLHDRDELLKAIFNATPGYIYYKDRHGVYQACNRSYAELTGMDRPEFIRGKSEFEMPWEMEQAEFMNKCDKEIIKTGIPLMNLQHCLLTCKGERVDVVAHKIPLVTSGREIIGILGIMYDVSQASRVAPNTGPGASSLEISQLNHFLRTQLGNITGFAELLQDDNLTESQREYLSLIQHHTHEMMTKIDKTFMEIARAGERNAADGETRGDSETVEPDTPIYPESEAANEAPFAGDETAVTASNEIIYEQAREPASTQSPSEAEAPKDGKVHILIADDVAENRLLMETLLKRRNYKITTCDNGKEAVELARKKVFDIILMDIQMPVMDGLNATQFIREESLNQDTAIIALSAMNSKGDEIICLEAGCDDFVTKPVKHELLLNKIHRFIERRKQLLAAETGGDIVSSLMDDPDYEKTIRMFVENLPSRIEEMVKAYEEGNLEELSFKVHSLKGIGSFAGFPVYTEKAKQLEKIIAAKDFNDIKGRIDELADLCRRTLLISHEEK